MCSLNRTPSRMLGQNGRGDARTAEPPSLS